MQLCWGSSPATADLPFILPRVLAAEDHICELPCPVASGGVCPWGASVECRRVKGERRQGINPPAAAASCVLLAKSASGSVLPAPLQDDGR